MGGRRQRHARWKDRHRLRDPVETEKFALFDPGRSLSQKVQDRTGARVVKAFNLCHADVWRTRPHYGRAVPLAGDDPAAKEFVAGLVDEVGATAVDVGGSEQAVHLEATAASIIRLPFAGADTSTTFNLVSACGSS